jgi:hypothetical protein
MTSTHRPGSSPVSGGGLASPPLAWGVENLVLDKPRVNPDFVAQFSPPCEGGVRGGGPGRINYRVFKGASSTRLVATLGNDLETRPNALKTREEIGFEIVTDPGSKRRGKPFTVSEACVSTPLAPPSQGGGRRDAPSFDRAQQKHASRYRPSGTVNTTFSSAQGGTVLATRPFVTSTPHGLVWQIGASCITGSFRRQVFHKFSAHPAIVWHIGHGLGIDSLQGGVLCRASHRSK